MNCAKIYIIILVVIFKSVQSQNTNLEQAISALEWRMDTLEKGAKGDPGLRGPPGRVASRAGGGNGIVILENRLARVELKLKHITDNALQNVRQIEDLRGPQGYKGEPGLPGLFGPRGAPGHKGVPGLPGEDGLPGLPGAPGDDGRPGFPGTQGEPGLPGDKGERGEIRSKRSVDDLNRRLSVLELRAQNLLHLKGEKGMKGQQGMSGRDISQASPIMVYLRHQISELDRHMASSLESINFIFVAENNTLIGPKGYKGEKGEKGNYGLFGESGRQGEVGEPGESSFEPRGPKGESGLPGVPGLDGLPGTQGEKGQKGESALQGTMVRRKRGFLDSANFNDENSLRLRLTVVDEKLQLNGETGEPGYRGRRGKGLDEGTQLFREIASKIADLEDRLGELQSRLIDRPLEGVRTIRGPIGDRGNPGEEGSPGLPGEPGAPGPPGLKAISGERGQKGESGFLGLPGRPGFPGQKGEKGSTGQSA